MTATIINLAESLRSRRIDTLARDLATLLRPPLDPTVKNRVRTAVWNLMDETHQATDAEIIAMAHAPRGGC
jgi:hypothetical protein